MDTAGFVSPDTPDDAREIYEELGPVAQVQVKEITRAMSFDPDEYDRRVTEEVIATARDALFASLLRVHVADREAYLEWRSSFDGEVFEAGSEHVDNAVWHVFDDEAVAATFQSEREAAVATLRRQAFGRLYRDLFYE